MAAQTGGTTVFNFLAVPTAGRQAALGGKLLSVRDADPTLAVGNPSLLRPDLDRSLSLQCVDFFSNAFYGNADYIRNWDAGTFRFGVHAISYGRFDGYDIYENETGTFSAGDYVLTAGFGREIVPGKVSMGMNVKGILSKDVVSVVMAEPPRDSEIVPEDIPVDIMYEDDDVIVVNKRAGMVVHPAYGNYSGTLVNALSWYLGNRPDDVRPERNPFLVHRIDKDTSGVLLVAKNEMAQARLAHDFFYHNINQTATLPVITC